VGGTAGHRDALLGRQQRPDPAADQRLVVDQQHPDHARPPGVSEPARSRGRTGSSALIRNPPPGPGPADSSPPIEATRSRMPIRPAHGAAAAAGPARPTTSHTPPGPSALYPRSAVTAAPRAAVRS